MAVHDADCWFCYFVAGIAVCFVILRISAMDVVNVLVIFVKDVVIV